MSTFDELYQRAITAFQASGKPIITIDPSDVVEAGSYKLRVKKDDMHGGYVGSIHGSAHPGAILESRGHSSKISAANAAIKDFASDHPREGQLLEDAYGAQLQAWHDIKTGGSPSRPQIVTAKVPAAFKLKAPFAALFKKGMSGGGPGPLVVLGDDPLYSRHFKMPKWNKQVTALDTPDVAIRHANTLGVSTSKAAHRQRAEHFKDLRAKLTKEHSRLVNLAEKTYGAEGSLISGGLRDHWPSQVKDNIRFLAHASGKLGSAVHLHETLSKTRAPAFK